jgi:uncharacterized surface protein with fasciclin (FAS1) repeats
MKTKELTRLALLLAIAPLSPVAFAEEKEAAKPATEEKVATDAGSITASLRDSATFSILTKALKAAGLDGTLGSKGSYTVFAPTDEAFSKLKEGTLDKLLLPENKEKLRSLLMYHVLQGNFMSSDLKEGEVQTANGEKAEIDIDGATIEIEDSKVAKADLVLNNGVIHSIDQVLVPKSLDGFLGLDED